MIEAWLVPLAANRDDGALLSDDERTAAARFRFARDRDRFVSRRAGVRRLLGARLDADPATLAFTTNAFGKPALVEGGGLQFSVSRSGDLAFVVLADRAIGGDIERHDPRLATPDVANRFFAAAEIAQLAGLPGDAWTAGFFACWTRKEAYVKALGLGLSHPLDSFAVTIGADAPRFLAGAPGWSFASVEPIVGYHLAIAIEGRPPAEIVVPRRFEATVALAA